MNLSAMAVGTILAGGIIACSFGFYQGRKFLKVSGVVIIVIGVILLPLYIIAIGNSEWYKTNEKITILEIEPNQYYIETEDEYIYKTITYYDTGEKEVCYKKINKETNTFVETANIGKEEEAYLITYNRYKKNIYGIEINTEISQTKYVFYIPTS